MEEDFFLQKIAKENWAPIGLLDDLLEAEDLWFCTTITDSQTVHFFF